PDELVEGDVLRRLMLDGVYQWTLSATREDDTSAEESGTLTVQGGTTDLPLITEFTVSPEIFTPNQDGVSDRTQINVFVNVDHESLDVYLLNEAQERLPVVRREEGRELGQAGRHFYDYEGGVDIGADPPPDGDYVIVAEIRDREG